MVNSSHYPSARGDLSDLDIETVIRTSGRIEISLWRADTLTLWDALPAGWSALPAEFPAWSVARLVRRVTAAQALDGPDPDAAPKPTWDALVAAERAARLGSLPAALIREANRQAKARIAAAYVGRASRIEELTWRMNGRATAAQDAERARLVALCHALERRIGEAATIEALEAIDVTSDAAWAADDEGGEDGDEG